MPADLTVTAPDLGHIGYGSGRDITVDGTTFTVIAGDNPIRPYMQKHRPAVLHVPVTQDQLDQLRTIGAEVHVTAEDDPHTFRLISAPEPVRVEHVRKPDPWWSEPGRMPRMHDECVDDCPACKAAATS